MENSLLTIAIRSAFIWILIYIFATAIPAQSVTAFNKVVIATMVVFLSTIIEYIILAVKVPGFCSSVCGVSNTADFDRYLNDATDRIRLQEKTGPKVAPTEQMQKERLQQLQQQMAVQVQAQAEALAQAQARQAQQQIDSATPTQVPVIVAPATQQPVYPSAVPTAAPILPSIPMVAPPTPKVN
jgi:hypothetical protein